MFWESYKRKVIHYILWLLLLFIIHVFLYIMQFYLQ